MELRAYIAPLRKWWWLLALAALLAGATSYLVASRQPPAYEAQAILLIGSAINNPNPTGNEFWLSQQLAETYSNIAERDVVRQATMEALGLSQLPSYDAHPVPDTQLIEITVLDTSPQRVAVVANELASQLILRAPGGGSTSMSGARQQFIEQQLNELELKIDETNDEILAKQTELAGLFSAREIAEAQGQLGALEGKLNTLQANYASLLAGTARGAVNSLSLVERASEPSSPISNSVGRTVATAALVGLALAAAAAYLLEYLDDSVKTSDDANQAAGLPTLGAISDTKLMRELSEVPVTVAKPRAPVTEEYRTLRTALLYANVDTPIRVLLITSAGPGEGKSTTAANLAAVVAQSGRRVLLMDCDLRRPHQHEIFGKPGRFGLTDLLLELSPNADPVGVANHAAHFRHAILETQQPGLYLLPSGTRPPNPAELVGSLKMKLLIQMLARGFDLLIIDAPPVLAVTDATVLAANVESVLLLARAGVTRRSQLRLAAQRLRDVNANVTGVLLNRMQPHVNGSSYHYYYDRQREGAGDAAPAAAPARVLEPQPAPEPRPRLLTRIFSSGGEEAPR